MKTNPPRTSLSAIALVIAFSVQFLVVHQAAIAADTDALSDGASVLTAIKRDGSTDANNLIDKIVGSLPPGPTGSGLTKVDGNTDPSLLNDPNLVFIKNQDKSISYISKQRLTRAVQKVADVATRRPDADQLWQDAKAAAPWWAIPLVAAIELNGTVMQDIRTMGVTLVVSELSNDKKRRAKAGRIIKSLAPTATRPSGKPPTTTATPPSGTTPPTTATPPAPVVKPPDCTAEEAKLAAAKSGVAAGQLGAAETTIYDTDIIKCPKLVAGAKDVLQQINDIVADLTGRAAAAKSSCDASEIAKVAAELTATKHSKLKGNPASLLTRASALKNGENGFDQANANVKAGQYVTAISQLEAVKAGMTASGVQACPPYDRATKGIATINKRVDSLVSQANGAANGCNIENIDKMIARLSKIDHPRIATSLTRLQAVRKRCKKKASEPVQLTDADRQCISQNGDQSYSVQSGADGINLCDCRKPYVFNFDRTRCVEASQVMAEADTFCEGKFGSGAYAVKKKSNYKTYVCDCGLGTVWNCGKKRCVPRRKFLTALKVRATEICRARFGDSLQRVKVFASCKYNCVYAKKTSKRKPTRRPPSPGHSKQQTIVIGIIDIFTRTPTTTRTTPTPGCRKHHQKTTSVRHCSD